MGVSDRHITSTQTGILVELEANKADDYRKFILKSEVEFACDVLQWAYGEEDENEVPFMAVDLDNATLCNDGGNDYGNVGCNEDDPAMDCGKFEFALRDIQAGEEILCTYGRFDEPTAWEEMGLE